MFNGMVVKRKWGWYLTLLDRKYFKVKLLRFSKGKSCSKQYHHCRNELWLWLSGSGHFNNNYCGPGGVESGMAILIPKKYMHQYEAYENSLILEIQYGQKCEESDIVRV